MTELSNDDDIDLTHIIVKPLYFGLLVNVTVPLVLLFIIYYVKSRSAGVNHVGDNAQFFLYAFGALALLQTLAIVWWRDKLFKAPMIHRRETFEADFAAEYLKRCKPLFLAIAALSFWGFLFYFLTGRFQESAIFVIVSYLVFQIVRPRHGLVRRLIIRQRQLVEQGEFLRD